MLRLVQTGYAQPISMPVDPNAEFEPGQVAQLGVIGNNIVCGVSDGTAPIGIIDDIKTQAFSAAAIDEVVITQAMGVDNGSGTLDLDGDGIPDAIRTVVSYTYQIPGIPGDDSTQGSGKISIWFQRMIFQTDKFETNVRYPVNANLFVSESGLLTTRQATPDHPAIALVTGPPSAMFGTLEALLL